MPSIPFPNVPNVPGVPLLVRSATVPSAGALLNAAISQVVESIFGATVWGIFDQNGIAVLEPDTFLGIDFKNGAHVATHPVEDGGFETYNKVNTPYDCKVRVAIGSDETGRAEFLATCESMLKSIDIYSVVTPEKTYLNATLQNYASRRETRSGVSMLTVELWFLEVRFNPKEEKKVPASPSAEEPISGGQIQTQTYKTVAGDNSAPVWSEWRVL